MLDYDFLKIIYDYVKIYKEFPLPAIICDTDFQVAWSNARAKSMHHHITDPTGVQDFLEEYGLDSVRAELEERGNCTIRDGLSADGLCVSVSPLIHDFATVGVIVLCLSGREHPSAQELYRSSQAVHVLTGGIRDAAAEVFEALDLAAGKAELMNAGWVKETLNRAGVGGYGLLRIAGNVSEYAKLKNGESEPKFSPVRLPALLDELRDTVIELGKEAGIPIAFHLEPGEFIVRLDWELFQLAFFNLLHNSLFYTKPGNRIVISVREEKDWLLVAVSDQGLGIPARLVQALQEPYMSYRHDGGRAGAGLGLALARMILRAHGGRLRLDSREGEGTRVELVLPRATLTQDLPLGQIQDRYDAVNRFSPLYVGLMDAVYRGRM